MIGRVISHYRILEKIGEGGMGVVYKAEDLKLRRPVALKFLRDREMDASRRRRFLREAQAAASLQHPNICTVHEVDEFEGQVFFAMAFVEGRSLAERIADGPLEIAEAVDIAAQIADGLAAAHERGVVHRDIKAGNVIVAEGGRPVILDFGLAQTGGGTRITRTGATVGTAAYMSPEQAQGEPVDERTDVWALGVLLYEMAAGRLPFRGDYDLAVMYNIVNERQPPIRGFRPEAPADLERIVAHALAKDPAQRYRSAREFAADLRNLKLRITAADASTRAAAPILAPPIREEASNGGRAPKTALAAAAAALAAAALWFALGSPPGGLQWGIPQEKHLAVLPFENVGKGEASQAFCDGFVETLTGKLTELQQFQGGLMVVPSSEVRAERVASVSRARERFGVNLAVTGGLQPIGAGYRLTANLVDAASLRQLRSISVDFADDDLDSLQDGIVRRVVGLLEIEMNVEAAQALSEGGTRKPRAYELYLRGKGYLSRFDQEGNVDAAVRALEQAIAEDPGYAPAHAALSEAYWQRYNASGDRAWAERSVAAAERAVEANSRLAVARASLGEAYRRTGRPAEAEREFEAALALDPLNPDARAGMARVYQGAGRETEAEKLHLEAVRMQPQHWGAHSSLGVFYYRAGRYAEAERAFRRAIELTPDNPLNHRNLGGVLLAAGRYDEARAALQRSIEIEPSPLAYANLGSAEYLQGRFDKAAEAYREAVDAAPGSDLARFNLAEALRRIPGREAEAEAAYRRAIETAEARLAVRADDAAALLRVARSYAKLGEPEAARAALDRVPAEARRGPGALYAAAVVHELAGERERALEALADAIEAGQGLAEIEADPDLAALRRDRRYRAPGRR